MTTPSYYWIVGTGQVGYSRIYDGEHYASWSPDLGHQARFKPSKYSRGRAHIAIDFLRSLNRKEGINVC